MNLFEDLTIDQTNLVIRISTHYPYKTEVIVRVLKHCHWDESRAHHVLARGTWDDASPLE